MPIDRRAEALTAAEQLLTDFELSQIEPLNLIRRASRIARLLDDADALEWLSYEIIGYDATQTPEGLSPEAKRAAQRSNRAYIDDEGKRRLRTDSVSSMQAKVETYRLHMASAVDAPISISSANPRQTVKAPPGNADERYRLTDGITVLQPMLDQVLGSIYQYVAAKVIELRFGSAVETAFDRIRNFTEAEISDLVPTALQKLTAAFELSTSNNPEHWADAASYCRKLLIAVADVLQPIGEPINGRPNGAGNYVNRLVFWIENKTQSQTVRKMIVSDLDDFGKRLDAFTDAGNKGAHADFEQSDADRAIIGTYILISDILRLRSADHAAEYSANANANANANAKINIPVTESES